MNAADLSAEQQADLAGRGMRALIDGLGIADALRFVQLHHRGTGNWVEDRHRYLEDLRTPADMVAALRQAGRDAAADEMAAAFADIPDLSDADPLDGCSTDAGPAMAPAASAAA